MRIRTAVIGVALLAGTTFAVEFRLRPVSASKPHYFDGDMLVLLEPGGTVTLECYISGWDPDGDGEPLLRSYQVHVDADSFDGGETGFIGLERIACSSHTDCPGTVCLAGTPRLCDAFAATWCNVQRDDFVFFGIDSLTVQLGAQHVGVAAVTSNQHESAVDSGLDRYVGSFQFDVSVGARGLFTLDLREEVSFGVTPDDMVLIPQLQSARILVTRDCNANGQDDSDEIAAGLSPDCNANGRPDACEIDCNHNGIPDDCDLVSGTSQDLGMNGVPDECDPDCNLNGSPDDSDLLQQSSADCNQNSVPDECELGGDSDCNGNAVSDLCELFLELADDCNQNFVPDSCDVEIGSSFDCAGEGRPDECENDCNRNSAADSCDLVDGTSEDINADAIPDECLSGFWLTPVGANVPHVIESSTIVLPQGGATILLDLRVGGWGRGANAGRRLQYFELFILQSSFVGTDGSVLTLADLPCADDADCIGHSICHLSGRCDGQSTLSYDQGHPNALIQGGRFETFATFNLLAGSDVGGRGAPDPGADRYAGTLRLSVPAEAEGTFFVQFDRSRSYWYMNDGAAPLPDLAPLEIIIAPPCDQATANSLKRIGAGSTSSSLAAALQSFCLFSVPEVTALGSNSLLVLPGSGSAPVALEVSSLQFPCISRYVVPGSYGQAVLGDSPVYLTPQQWGALRVSGADILPGTTYQVRGQMLDGQSTWASSETTWRFGDADGDTRADVIDLGKTVDILKSPAATPEMIAQANHWDCDGQGVINVQDIGAVVNAIKGLPFPCSVPCSRP